MYFGRSIFQSVVERLQSESLETSDDALAEGPVKAPRLPHHLIIETAAAEIGEPQSTDLCAAYYQAFELDEQFNADALDAAPIVEIAPAEPAKDYSYLSATSSEAVARELNLDKIKTVEALQGKRRHFARENHPDRVPIEWREPATLRMTAANQLIDEAIKLTVLMGRLGA